MQIVIPIALLFLLWRRWRFFAGFALSAGLVSLISLWVVGFAQTTAYARSLFSVGTNVAAVNQFPLRVSIMANLRGLFFGLMGLGCRHSGFRLSPSLFSVFVSALGALSFPSEERSSGRVRHRDHGQRDCELLPVHSRPECFADSDRHNAGPIHPDRSETPATTAGRAAAWMSAALLVAPMCIFLIPDIFTWFRCPVCVYGHPDSKFSPRPANTRFCEI